MHHLPTGQVNVFPANYTTVLGKALRLACNGSNLSKGELENPSYLHPAFITFKARKKDCKEGEIE